MNIREIKNTYEKARAMPHSLARARLMLAVQQWAAQSRSARAYDIEAVAHLAATMAINHAPAGQSHERAELGRIRLESNFRFTVGGTPSRRAIR